MAIQRFDRFPVAGLPADRRAAFWEGDFHEIRGSGLKHAAYDIFVTAKPPTSARYKGAAIVAPLAGRVLLKHPRTSPALPGVGHGARGGNYVWMRGSDGFDYYFAHLDRTVVQPGQRVVAGQLLGYLGDSGNARGRPHLHFAVRKTSGGAVEAYGALRASEPTSYQPPVTAGSGSTPSGSVLGPVLAIAIPLGAYGLWRLLS